MINYVVFVCKTFAKRLLEFRRVHIGLVFIKTNHKQFFLFTCLQVHARNILRALYKETKLGEDVFPFVADGVRVAIEGFLSEIWAVS